MSCEEYNLPFYFGGFVAEDREDWSSTQHCAAADGAHSLSLEDEIRLLRTKMEQMFVKEKSFTSDIVIEISTLLDLKINEYMKRKQR